MNECSVNANCINRYGDYECACKAGFKDVSITEMVGTNCANIDECLLENDCDLNAKCTDTVGSYLCQCNSGAVMT